MGKAIAFVVCAALIALMVLGILWGVWALWCWVWPQIWASGPTVFIAPSYWLFIGVWFLASLVARVIFPRANGA